MTREATLPLTRLDPSPTFRRVHSRFVQFFTFAMVGGLSFVVDIGVYNALRLTVMADKPIGAKVASVAVATVVAWLGNRYLTFRDHRGSDRHAVVREAALFAAINVAGLAIAAACLFVSHYILGFRSPLADNIAGNGVGLVLGMLFRYLAYRFIVFRHPRAERAGEVDRAHDADRADPQHAASPVEGAAR